MAEISVLLPAYNHEAYITKTIGSLLAQSQKDLEIIAVDDGSTDQTGRLLDELAKKDRRLRVFHKPNGGVSSALNYALERASGRWIASCGSDDMVPPNAYRTLLKKGKNADVVIGEFTEINDQGDKTRVRLGDRVGGSCFEALFAMPVTWNKIIRRDLLCRNALWFSDVLLCEDLILLAEIAACKPRYAFVPKSVYWYRNNTISSASMTHIYTKVFFEAHVAGRERILAICEAADIREGYRYVYRDSLGYLADHLQKMKLEDFPEAMMMMVRFLEKGKVYLDAEHFEHLFFLTPEAFRETDGETYQRILRQIPPEERVLRKFAAGEMGLQFARRCVAAWWNYRMRRK